MTQTTYTSGVTGNIDHGSDGWDTPVNANWRLLNDHAGVINARGVPAVSNTPSSTGYAALRDDGSYILYEAQGGNKQYHPRSGMYAFSDGIIYINNGSAWIESMTYAKGTDLILLAQAIANANYVKQANLSSSLPIATLAEVQAGTAGKIVEAANAKANYLSKTDTAAQTMAGALSAPAIYAPNALVQRANNTSQNYDSVTETGIHPFLNLAGTDWTTLTVFDGGASTGIVQEEYDYINGRRWRNRTNHATPTWSAWQPLGGASLGVNQTYQDVTASRAAGVTYTNSTGAPIYVIMYAPVLSAQLKITVNGTLILSMNGGNVSPNGFTSGSNAFFVVPNGQTYSYTLSSGSLTCFTELRA
jgi:hypothetical protein